MQSQIAIPLFKRRGIFIDREQGGGGVLYVLIMNEMNYN